MELAFVLVAKFAIAILLAALAAYAGVFVFDRTTGEMDEWAELRAGNAAVGITLGAYVLGVAIVIQTALQSPDVPADLPPGQFPVYALAELAVRFLISLVMGMAGVLVGVFIYDRLTGEIDEFAAIKDGNIAVAVTLAAAILSVALLIAPVSMQVAHWIGEVMFG